MQIELGLQLFESSIKISIFNEIVGLIGTIGEVIAIRFYVASRVGGPKLYWWSRLALIKRSSLLVYKIGSNYYTVGDRCRKL